MRLVLTALLGLAGSAGSAGSAGASIWPSLDLAAPITVGGGDADAALVVGVENYAYLPPVPGANDNADAWYRYLVTTRKVPVSNVHLLRDGQATHDLILMKAAEAQRSVKAGGTLWFVFIGHGAATPDGKDSLLVGADAQQSADVRFFGRSVEQKLLLALLAKSDRPAQINVIVDACFSGRDSRGAALIDGLQPVVLRSQPGVSDPRLVMLTAAAAHEFAGPLPGANRPAFSYLALGGVRGWADEDVDGEVTAAELEDYTKLAIRTVVRSRSQTPFRVGKAEAVVARSAGEAGPDLSKIVVATRPRRPSFGRGLDGNVGRPAGPTPTVRLEFSGLSDVDVELVEALDHATELDGSDSASPWEQIGAWEALAQLRGGNHEYARLAQRRAEALRQQSKVQLQYESDLSKLQRLLRTSGRVLTKDQKSDLLQEFIAIYEPHREVIGRAWVPLAPEVDMVQVTAGKFLMGCNPRVDEECFGREKPTRKMLIGTFNIDKTEVTVAAYRFCVQAGVCEAPPPEEAAVCNYWVGDREQRPMNCVNWFQAETYCRWSGKRLPTEVEWEKAARGTDGRKYPWGNEAYEWRRLANIGGVDDTWILTSPVGAFPQGESPFGVLDMIGNVAEWTADQSRSGRMRIVKGSGLHDAKWVARPSYKRDHPPAHRGEDVGFRCAVD